MSEIGFDIISDLNLTNADTFDWEGKASSLYCIVAGNISSSFRVVATTLIHLSKFYQGVFYVPGTLEYQNTDDFFQRTEDLALLCSKVPNIILLHQQVVVIEGVAIVGANGWNDAGNIDSLSNMLKTAARYEDTNYLKRTIEKLQRHLDVKKIIVVSSAVPREDLYYGEEPIIIYDQLPLCNVLVSDTEKKVNYWVFGTYPKLVETCIDYTNYLNNPYKSMHDTYWPKRLTVLV